MRGATWRWGKMGEDGAGTYEGEGDDCFEAGGHGEGWGVER